MSSKECENTNNGAGFTLIVVLFILLIIVGATFIGDEPDHGYGGCH